MTLSLLPPACPTPPPDAEPDWAVVEILHDGSFGRTELVRALEPVAAARIARDTSRLHRAVLSSDELGSRLGLALAASGRLVEAGWTFRRVVDRPGAATDLECAGHLSLVEACRGDLRRASARAEAVLTPGSDLGAGVTSALLATAWIHAERDEHAEAARHLALAAESDAPPDAWTGAVRTLLEARLLLTTRPDSAVQLLAHARDGWDTSPADRTEWAAAAVEVARAEALLALGEPHRALSVLTPVPAEAAVEGSVTVAAACLEIGDVRGAESVLSGVRDRLEVAPLATQLQAWLLEARIADQRGRPERVVHLVDRALRSASCEDLRTPLRREWSWLRLQVERDHALARSYRDFLRCLRDVPHGAGRAQRPTRPPGPDEALGANLTLRENEVLELLARMYSTDEIAAALFVSANTVKTHLKGIYAKLRVSRRADAVRRGQHLGLC